MAERPCVAVTPISLAYSGSILGALPAPLVPRCQAATNAPNSNSETIAARKARNLLMVLSRRKVPEGPRRSDATDREALHILLRLAWIEGLPHHGKSLRGARRRRKADLLHQLRGV